MAGKDQEHVNQQQKAGRHTLITGIGYSGMTDKRTVAQRNRAARQEGLRDFLAQQKLIEKVIEISNKLVDADEEYDALDIQRMRTAAELNLKLTSKFLPDLKSTELTGPDGGDIIIAVQRKRFDGDD